MVGIHQWQGMAHQPLSLTINIAMFSVAFGNLVWSSYSGFCGSSGSYDSILLTELHIRRASPNLSLLAPDTLHWLGRGCHLSLRRSASQLARHTSNRVLERHERWGGSCWGSVCAGGARTGHGHILRCKSIFHERHTRIVGCYSLNRPF